MKTIVIGASPNASRTSYEAVKKLRANAHEVIALGIKPGQISDVEINTERPDIQDVHTITLYLSPQNQIGWYAYILAIQPNRIIFNPGTENAELKELAEKNNIEAIEACTLVMLSLNQF